MERKECYFVLGLEEGASLAEVKSAYRKLAKQYHPDRTDGDEFLVNMFRRIHSAYQQLTTGKKDTKTTYSSPRKDTKTSSSNKKSNDSIKIDPETEEMVMNHRRIVSQLISSKYKLSKIQKEGSIRYLSLSKALKIVGVAIVIGFFFFPNRYRNPSAEPPIPLEGTWVVTEEANLYGKPDNKTTPIESLPTGKGVDSIGSTKYFYKISFATENGIQEGYLLKKTLKRR